MEPDEPTLSQAEAPAWFATTHWSVVLGTQSTDPERASEALSRLCQAYWKPVYSYVNRQPRHRHDAEDLTQQFFMRFIEKEHYRLAQRDRGRFRSFLLTMAKNFLINEWERASAQKRGGGQMPVSLDEELPGEDRPRIDAVDTRTADLLYERNWALTLLARVRERLAAEYAEEGKADRFTQLEKFLPGEESDRTYAEAAVQFGVAEGTIKSDVHRLKCRYRDLLREEIAHTVATPAEIDHELRHLIEVLGQPRG